MITSALTSALSATARRCRLLQMQCCKPFRFFLHAILSMLQYKIKVNSMELTREQECFRQNHARQSVCQVPPPSSAHAAPSPTSCKRRTQVIAHKRDAAAAHRLSARDSFIRPHRQTQAACHNFPNRRPGIVLSSARRHDEPRLCSAPCNRSCSSQNASQPSI